LDDPLIWVRAVHFGATMMVTGGVIFLAFIAEPAFRSVDDTRFAACSRARPHAGMDRPRCGGFRVRPGWFSGGADERAVLAAVPAGIV
jgi:hypothetical protein